MLRAVIFDLDGTLYDFDAAHAHAFGALTEYACASFGLTPERFRELHQEADRILTRRAGINSGAIHNRLIRYQIILELIGQPFGYAPRMSELYWHTLTLWMKPLPGLHEALRDLKAMGLKLGVGTNMTADWQYEKLEKLGIIGDFDFIVTSEEAGSEKPDSGIFMLCAEKAGCEPSECAFVGDSVSHDVVGALNAGMRAVWLNANGSTAEPVKGACTVKALSELKGLFETLRAEGD